MRKGLRICYRIFDFGGVCVGLYQAEGIVLANRDLGEADRIVRILCRGQGKIEAVAKGARRPRNRLVGLTLPFNVLRMSVYAGRSLDELSQAEGIRSFQSLREDLLALAYASYLTELTDEFLPEREPSEAVYDLLLRSLAGLEAGSDPENLTRFFELALLDLAGFRPAIKGCLACGRPPAQTEVAFSPLDGGYYCLSCLEAGRESIGIPGPAVLAMDRGLQGEETFLAGLTGRERRSIARILASFIQARLDRELRSYKFLTRILAETEAGTD